jgi:peptide/nickel transport system permease protein
MRTSWFVVRRLLAMAGTLLIVSFLVFSLLYVLPGDPAVLLLGPGKATPEAIAAIRAEYNLDAPFLEQYFAWLGDALHGDFGQSIRAGVPVTDMLAERMPVTVGLGLYAIVLTVIVAIPAGLGAGMRRGSRLDRGVTIGSLVGLSAPPFAVAVLLIYVFAVALGWFPVFGAGDDPLDMLYHLTLPAVALAFGNIAIVSRQTRAATMDVAHQDYVTFARARGTPARTVWRTYVLRNASLPVITIIGLVLAFSLTGAVLIEWAFALPGIGALLVESVSLRDVPVVQAVAMLTAVVVLSVNLVVDVTYFLLDPRLRRAEDR